MPADVADARVKCSILSTWSQWQTVSWCILRNVILQSCGAYPLGRRSLGIMFIHKQSHRTNWAACPTEEGWEIVVHAQRCTEQSLAESLKLFCDFDEDGGWNQSCVRLDRARQQRLSLWPVRKDVSQDAHSFLSSGLLSRQPDGFSFRSVTSYRRKEANTQHHVVQNHYSLDTTCNTSIIVTFLKMTQSVQTRSRFVRYRSTIDPTSVLESHPV